MGFWSDAGEVLEWAEIGVSCFAGFEKSSGRGKFETKLNRDIKEMARKVKGGADGIEELKKLLEEANDSRNRNFEEMERKVKDCLKCVWREKVIEDGAEKFFAESKCREPKDAIKFFGKTAASAIPRVANLFMSPKTAKILSKVGKVAGFVGPLISFGKNFCANMEEFKDDGAVCSVGKAGTNAACQTGGAIAGGWIGGVLGSAVPVVGNAIGAAVGTIIGEKIGGAVFDLITKPVETIKKAWGWVKSWF